MAGFIVGGGIKWHWCWPRWQFCGYLGG